MSAEGGFSSLAPLEQQLYGATLSDRSWPIANLRGADFVVSNAVEAIVRASPVDRSLVADCRCRRRAASWQADVEVNTANGSRVIASRSAQAANGPPGSVVHRHRLTANTRRTPRPLTPSSTPATLYP